MSTVVEKEERQARKAARREKQRQANLLRAQKMHVARLAISPDARGIGKTKAVKTASLHIGCSGWFYWHWRNIFYPAGLPTSQWFEHYAQKFDTVELNAPFYSWPTLGTVQTWLRQAKDRNFVYTVKVSELITHIKRFKGTKELIKDFGYIADLLGPRMGCFLFQLPPSFHYTAARLKAIVSQLESGRRNVVEFRHKSWWNECVFKAFRDAGIIFCSCSGPKLPDQIVKTVDDIYIRFHGTSKWYRHDYSREELKQWAIRIKECGPRRVWVYFNNDREAYALKNALQLHHLLTTAETALFQVRA